MMTRKDCALISFAEDVLNILESSKEWGADEIDEIGYLAIETGLAELDDDKSFKIKEEFTN